MAHVIQLVDACVLRTLPRHRSHSEWRKKICFFVHRQKQISHPLGGFEMTAQLLNGTRSWQILLREKWISNSSIGAVLQRFMA